MTSAMVNARFVIATYDLRLSFVSAMNARSATIKINVLFVVAR